MRFSRFPFFALVTAVVFITLLLYATNYMRLDGVEPPPDRAFRPDTTN